MTTVFASAPGVATVVAGGDKPNLPFAINMNGITRTYGTVTNMDISENVNFQVTHTLDDELFAAIFGDRAVDLKVGGMAFNAVCKNGAVVSTAYQHTIEEMIQLYHANKASKVGTPRQIAIGRTAYKALLIGANFGISDAETKVGQWFYRFLAVYDQQV